MAKGGLPRILQRKSVRLGLSLIVIFFVYLILFISRSSNDTFSITGGVVGGISALVVILNIGLRHGFDSPSALLFWRAVCDIGFAIRFITIPAFNIYICGSTTCNRSDGDEDKCSLPSVLFEFFLVAAESWFLCNGLELYYSITNPFANFQSRVKYYHIGVWFTASLFTLIPFIIDKFQNIYGFWYVSDYHDRSAICWLKVSDVNKLGLPLWFLFIMPLLLVYVFCLLVLWIAYKRLQRGLTRSFLPRLRLLVSNTSNVFVLAMFWSLFFLLYAWNFFTRHESGENDTLFNFLTFTIGSKGFASFVVWILVVDANSFGRRKTIHRLQAQQLEGGNHAGGEDDEETVDANKSLREEVLSFATSGIRSTAKAGPSLTEKVTLLVRTPNSPSGGSGVGRTKAPASIITPVFFLKFMLGESEQVRAIRDMLAQKRHSVASGSMNPSIIRTTTMQGSMIAGGELEPRLSQRPTVVSTADRQTFGNAPSSTASSNRSTGPAPMGIGVRESVDIEDPNHISMTHGAQSEVAVRPSDMLNADFEGGKTAPKDSIFTSIWKNTLKFLEIDQSDSVEFHEFEPYHFRRVRLSSGCTDGIYINAFSNTIKERLTQGGASGAFFFFSKGEKFIAKSCTDEEMETLKTNARQYADYMVANPGSYISKIFGVYQLKIYGNNLSFFVMNNLFYNDEGLTMNEKYDIKGSWVSRNATPPIEGQSVTCSYCEQKFVYRKKLKMTRIYTNSSNSSNITASAGGNTNSTNLSHSTKGLDTTMSPLTKMAVNAGKGTKDVEEGEGAGVENQQHGENKEGIDENGDDEEDNNVDRSRCPYTVNGVHEPNLILKDNDIKYKIRLSLDDTMTLLRQIRLDAEFLYSLGIMDYSLLVGVHNTEYEVRDDVSNPNSTMSTTGGISISAAGSMSYHPRLTKVKSERSVTAAQNANNSAANALTSALEEGEAALSKIAEEVSRMSDEELNGEAGLALAQKLEVYRVVGPDSYFMGIIDFQQRWNVGKKMERFFKINFKGADPHGLSAIEPEQYKERFLRKIEDILDIDSFGRVMSTT